GFYSLYLKEADEVLSLIYGPANRVTAQLEDFLAVAQITKAGELFEWESRASYLPWTTVGARPVFAGPTDTLNRLASAEFNPRELVYLPVEAKSRVTMTNMSKARILESRISTHDALVRVETDQTALLIVSQTFYHPWHASVDGRRQRIWRANHGFQAVTVPAGSHVVRLVYEEPGFYAGVLISLLFWSGCFLGLFRSQVKKEKGPSRSLGRV